MINFGMALLRRIPAFHERQVASEAINWLLTFKQSDRLNSGNGLRYLEWLRKSPKHVHFTLLAETFWEPMELMGIGIRDMKRLLLVISRRMRKLTARQFQEQLHLTPHGTSESHLNLEDL